MVHERLKALRKSLEERETAAKAKARAKARESEKVAKRREEIIKEKAQEKLREREKKEKRIKEGEPENLREEIAVAKREAKKGLSAAARTAKQEFSAVKSEASAERQFLAQELGISTEHAAEVAQTGVSIAEQVKEATGSLDQLDIDGDGDTDILQGLDEPGGTRRQSGGRSRRAGGAEPVFDPTEPLIDLPGRLEEPLFNEDVFTEPSLAEPLPGEQDMGL